MRNDAGTVRACSARIAQQFKSVTPIPVKRDVCPPANHASDRFAHRQAALWWSWDFVPHLYRCRRALTRCDTAQLLDSDTTGIRRALDNGDSAWVGDQRQTDLPAAQLPQHPLAFAGRSALVRARHDMMIAANLNLCAFTRTERPNSTRSLISRPHDLAGFPLRGVTRRAIVSRPGDAAGARQIDRFAVTRHHILAMHTTPQR